MFEIFKNDGREVYHYWVKYVERIDKGVEDALRATVKKSLQEISKAINGEGKNRDGAVEIHPLFKMNIVLDMQKVDLSPNLQKLEESVSKV
jgi:dynein heavy chain